MKHYFQQLEQIRLAAARWPNISTWPTVYALSIIEHHPPIRLNPIAMGTSPSTVVLFSTSSTRTSASTTTEGPAQRLWPTTQAKIFLKKQRKTTTTENTRILVDYRSSVYHGFSAPLSRNWKLRTSTAVDHFQIRTPHIILNVPNNPHTLRHRNPTTNKTIENLPERIQ